ncbi:MAG: N-6 DNA methylase [Synergistaceae bacterium]|nr:N-6 DNA methylase [Synergistaceae bacterium]
MITVENFAELLKIMGFSADIYSSVFTDGEMSVDFNAKKLIYPPKLRGREHNTSFTAPENFVVFECVFRLLTKGYRPEDIELEKAWSLGRTQKGGRADICVYEKDSDDVLMIIECKTWGREFDKAKADTLNDGAQLFSYWQQENSAKWLVLYASDIKDGAITFKSPAVNCSDDNNLIIRADYDDSVKLYRDAHSVVEKFTVWQETYNLELYDNVIFSENSQAYDVGLKPLRKRDLIPFEKAEGIVNRFEEILRHNSVSDKENAFNRLIALFICKLVDELTKDEDSELAFQYRPRADSYETLQDRLQLLYTQGMKEFMREDITYISADYPERLFANYNGADRKNAIDELKAAFRKLKYFTNNDFAFVDVHNEKLFYQNGKVLVEVVQLFQNYRIVHEGRQQILGDLFEQLLDKGFKQNEGQFFTPIPLTRFIWDSLPLRRFETWPKVIDYACGAGHFLIEAVEAINHFIPNPDGNNYWTRDSIFGIEKDYRLARVSKVSMFMNGAGESNIVFGDGLENSELITPGTFDILTANPPYSVASFKPHLTLKENSFALLDSIGNSGSEIEVLFVERIGQLLASEGIAAVILPSSILSNSSDSYTGARKELLGKFMLRAIVKLGSKTFGATGTNTVIMFLERYAYPPERSSLVKDSRDAILEGRDLTDWEDEEILRGYLELQGLSAEEWGKLVNRSSELEDLPDYFRNYREAFDGRKDNHGLKPEEYCRKFWEYVRKIEGEKLFYYGMTYRQRTAVILAPSDNAGQKEFLGYDWSSKKGHEGIQYVEPRGGKMYVNVDREAEGTLADVVRQAFGGGEVEMRGDAGRYSRVVRTVEMLDFSRVGFDASINLQPSEKVKDMNGKTALAKILDVITERVETEQLHPAQYVTTETMLKDCKGIETFTGNLPNGSVYQFRRGDILLSNIRPYLRKLWLADFEGGCSTNVFVLRVKDGEVCDGRYVFNVLAQPEFFDYVMLNTKGLNMPQGKREHILDYIIPLPPMDIQQAISSECQAIDSQTDSLNAKISSCHQQIESIFREVEALPPANRLAFDDKRAFTIAIGKRVLNSDLIDSGKIPVFSANVFEPFGHVSELLRGFEDFTSDSILWGIDGDFMVNFMHKDSPFYPTDHCGVIRVINAKIHPRYAARVLEREGRRQGFSRSYRASLDRVGRITFDVPDIEAQNRAMNEVLNLETQITQAKTDLQALSGRKAAILKKYL